MLKCIGEPEYQGLKKQKSKYSILNFDVVHAPSVLPVGYLHFHLRSRFVYVNA